MANIAATPFSLANAVLKIGSDNYEASVSTVEAVPATTTATWKGLTPTASYTSVGSATWTLNLSYAQDWEATASLSNYLLDNAGQTKTIDFFPVAGTGKKGFRVTVQIVPGNIGGAVDTVAVGSVTLGVVGQPTRISATA